MSVTIEDIPDEILEYIFYLLPPYEDVRNCRAVNRKWNQVASGIISRVKRSFGEALSSHNVSVVFPQTNKDTITRRYAHSACRYHDSMYIFGGFTSSFSSFNDLWKLDFSTRAWTRICVEGKCPVPKAGASMVTYNDKLVLFGGMLPHAGALFQCRSVSNNVHTFDVTTNTWDEIIFAEDTRVPGLARHSATIHGHVMIVFGGLLQRCCSNALYSLDLRTMNWQHATVQGESPLPRFGQSQVFIDDTHLLIMGGMDTDSVVVDDAWLLDMSIFPWRWSKVDIGTQVLLMRAIWCHPVCKVGKYIVIFKPVTNNPLMYTDWFPIPLHNNNRLVAGPHKLREETNVNGKRGVLSPSWLKRENTHDEDALRHKMALSNIGYLRSVNTLRTAVELHLLDTSYLLEQGRLVHLRGKVRPLDCSPDIILYSVIEGNGELLLFGGIQRNVYKSNDSNQEIIPEIMNTLKIIKLKKRVV